MKKFLASLIVAALSCVIAVCAGCKDRNGEKKPELLKDGVALTITAGETQSIDLSEYISIEGTEYAYAAESSDGSVATVSVEGNTATVTAVAAGSAEITASADAVQVKFAVTVNKKPEQPKPAPVFKDRTLAYDLKDKQSEQITLAPESGEATYRYSYALKAADAYVMINGDKLTAAYDSATQKTLIIVAKYTDSAGSFTGEKTVEFKVTVTVTDTREPEEISAPVLKESAVVVEKDIYGENESSLTIDFAENVENPDNVELGFTVRKGEEAVTLTGSTYNFVYETYDETATTVVYSVEIAYNIDGEDGALEYTYTLKIKDTSAYRVENGNFDNDLEGWTVDGNIGAITDKSTFWEQEFPMFNDGKYFSGDGRESGKGTLKSSLFKVGGQNKIKFMLGAAGNKDCYITLEREDGTVLEIWRNTKFEDVGGWQAEEIGKTQFACNLVTYVADLSAYAGETVRVVLNDNAEKDFAFFNFDKLVTYYATEEEVPEGVATVNELADKTELKEAVDGAITEQGDYTEESFAAYTQSIAAARAVLEKLAVTQQEVDAAKAAIDAAYGELAARTPEEKAGAEKEITLITGKHKEIIISDYIDGKGLSGLTYTATAADENVTLSEIAEGKFTVTAGSAEGETQVAIAVAYKGEVKLTVTLTVTVISEKAPELKEEAIVRNIDLYSEENKTDVTLDFADNVTDYGVELEYTVTCDGSPVTLDGTTCTFTYGSYTETDTVIVYSVHIAYALSGGEGELEYTYTLKIKDTGAYRVENGNFDNDLEGWMLDGNIGAITDKSTFWEQQFPMFNDGKYFSGDGKEGGKGILKSSLFKVGGQNKITFMLGAAGNKDCYVTLEKEDGTVLEIWRNTKFEDVGGWQAEEIGKTQFACNLVTYVADLSAYAGETVRVVLNDNAEKDFAFFNFDKLVTYYATEEEVPEGVATVNELADKTELKEAVDGAITEQGDYTEESFAAYTQSIAAAQAVLDKLAVTQQEVDAAKAAIDAAYGGLALRVPEEKEGAEKTVIIFVGNSKELTISDYVDDKSLSDITFTVETADAIITVGDIENGKFTVTALEEKGSTTVTITVKYKGETKLTVTLTVNVEEETAPTLKEEAVEKNIDLFTLEDKEKITIDFAENVNNIGGLKLGFTATKDNQDVELDGSLYTLTFDTYSETATTVVFNVKIAYSVNGVAGEQEYIYTLYIKDTSEYQIVNGNFDNDLEGWTLSNSKLGAVNADETYWAENVPFKADGKFFNAYATNVEYATGTLTSSAFKIGGSGRITYKLGGAKNADKVYLDVIEKDTGAILARYYNNAFSDDSSQTAVRGCTLIAYKADLSAHLGKTVYIRIVDSGVTDYGLFFVDSFVTYYSEAPTDGFTVAEVVTERPSTVYEINNGGFENGLVGWTVSGGDIGVVSSDKGYWNGGNPDDVANEYGKEGDKLFTWWTWDGENGREINREGNIGTLTSSMFVLKAGKYVSFRFGGGENRNVFIELVNADSGSVIAVFRNDKVNGGKLISYNYKVDELSADALCYFRVVDNAVDGWGCFTADDFKVNLDSAPEGSNAAVNRKEEYLSVVNGSFETGNLDGWKMFGELGAVVNTEIEESWYQKNDTAKDGDYLFTFYYNNGTGNVNVEQNTGIVRSGAFILEKNGIISFRLGAAHNSEVYINVYTTGGKLLATFRNNSYEQGTVMVQYYYQFDNAEETSCYFEVVDNATEGYGCIVMDDFRVNLESAPEGAVLGSDKTKAELN